MNDNFLSDTPSKKHNQDHRLGQHTKFNGIVCCGDKCPACLTIVMLENNEISIQLAALEAEAREREQGSVVQDTFDPPTDWNGEDD